MGGKGARIDARGGGARMGREDRWKRRGLGWMETMGAGMN